MKEGGGGGANTKTGLYFEGEVDFLTFIKRQKNYNVKGNEIFYEWEVEDGKPYSDEDRILFVTGFIKGYLFLNQVEVCNG